MKVVLVLIITLCIVFQLFIAEAVTEAVLNGTSENFGIDNQPEVSKVTLDQESKDDDGSKIDVLCDPPPTIEGVLSPDIGSTEYTVGTKVYYYCKLGYVSQNPRGFSSICEIGESSGKGSWTVPDIACIPRSCGDPGYLINGRRIGNLFTFPNKVEYECELGYKLHGTKARYCQASGGWSGRIPTCERITCEVPSDPANGRARYFSLEYGSELRYECNRGFVLTNNQIRVCNENGKWSNDEPTCIEAACPPPLPPEHGSIQVLSDLKVDSIVIYSCHPGRVMIGSGTAKCLISGEWTFPAPQCLLPCLVPRINNGELGRYEITRYRNSARFVQVFDKVNPEETVILRCRRGFMPIGMSIRLDGKIEETEITCTDGKWSQSLECKTTSCLGDPPTLENGRHNGFRRKHGHAISYSCDLGYRKTQPGNVKCDLGTWIGDPPKCDPSPCTVPTIQNGEVGHSGNNEDENQRNADKLYSTLQPGASVESGAVVTLRCKPDFVPVGKKENSENGDLAEDVKCEYGEWSKPLSCKTTQCLGEPEGIENGKAVVKNRSHGHTIYYICDKGYHKIIGHVTCRFGTWVGNPPKCVKSTGTVQPKPLRANPLNVTETNPCSCIFEYQEHSFIARTTNGILTSGSAVKKGDRVILLCPASAKVLMWPNGLRFNESAELVCNACQTWQANDLPRCERNNSGDALIVYNYKLKILPGGIVEVPEKESVTLSCLNEEFGYPMWTVPTRSNVRLSYKVTYSEPNIYEAVMNITEANNDHAGTYNCYTTDTHGNRNQLTRLELRIAEPEVRCPEIDRKDKFNIIYNNDRKVNSIARYECLKENENVVGNNTRLCLGDGKWSGVEPVCREQKEIRCPLIERREVFIINFTNGTKVGSKASYSCVKLSQRIVSTADRICMENGEWSGTDPKCEEITCPPFVLAIGLQVSYSHENEVGSYANFSCRFPATLIGNSSAKCLPDGTWNNPQPFCVGITNCMEFRVAPPLQVSYSDENRIGSTATFRCTTSVLIGSELATCLDNATWSSPQPSCEDMPCKPFRVFNDLQVSYSFHDDFIATFTCKSSKLLVGSSTAKCIQVTNYNGYWNISKPLCIEMPCKPFPVSNDLQVSYSFHTGLTATFTCTPPKVLSGSSTAKCVWSTYYEDYWNTSMPSCEVRCPEIDGKGVFTIRYSNQRKIDSIAEYFCKDNGLVVSGTRETKCLPNSEWYPINPICVVPACFIHDLDELLPRDVEPNMENVESDRQAFDTKLQLHCKDNDILKGNESIVCGPDGKWKLGQVECVTGCQMNLEFSKLVIEPVADIYYVGQSVILSCPPGWKLSTDVVRVMCLTTGWSNLIPECIESTKM